MLSYNNDKIFKRQFVAEVTKHRKADMLEQGTYGHQNGHWKGCAVACSLRSLDIIKGRPLKVEYNSHSRFESEGLWPEWLARLEDEIFERLPLEASLLWPERLAKAVPVGVDLDPVKWKFCAFLMHENIERVLLLDIDEKIKTQVVSAIRQVLSVHEKTIQTGTVDAAAWSAAESAAWSAAESAAWSAARPAAWSAAESAAWSAAESAARSAAESAAWSAARPAAESAAWSAAYERYADKLIELLKSAK